MSKHWIGFKQPCFEMFKVVTMKVVYGKKHVRNIEISKSDYHKKLSVLAKILSAKQKIRVL